jgi:hypothetical protein
LDIIKKVLELSMVAVLKRRDHKHHFVVEAHEKAFANTVFKKECAPCAGTTGSLDAKGRAGCSRINGHPVPVTEVQAIRCDGYKPNVTAIEPFVPVTKKEKKK